MLSQHFTYSFIIISEQIIFTGTVPNFAIFLFSSIKGLFFHKEYTKPRMTKVWRLICWLEGDELANNFFYLVVGGHKVCNPFVKSLCEVECCDL